MSKDEVFWWGKEIVKHRPRPHEKFVNGVVWFVGCLCAVILKVRSPEDQVVSVMGGDHCQQSFFLGGDLCGGDLLVCAASVCKGSYSKVK